MLIILQDVREEEGDSFTPVARLFKLGFHRNVGTTGWWRHMVVARDNPVYEVYEILLLILQCYRSLSKLHHSAACCSQYVKQRNTVVAKYSGVMHLNLPRCNTTTHGYPGGKTRCRNVTSRLVSRQTAAHEYFNVKCCAHWRRSIGTAAANLINIRAFIFPTIITWQRG